jgi:hypothetical protein
VCDPRPRLSAEEASWQTELWTPLLEGCQVALLNAKMARALVGKVREWEVTCVPPPIADGFLDMVRAMSDAEYKVVMTSTSKKERVVMREPDVLGWFAGGEHVPKSEAQRGLAFGSARLVKSKGSLRFTPVPVILEHVMGLEATHAKHVVKLTTTTWQVTVGSTMVSVEIGTSGAKFTEAVWCANVDYAKKAVREWPAAARVHLHPLLWWSGRARPLSRRRHAKVLYGRRRRRQYELILLLLPTTK